MKNPDVPRIILACGILGIIILTASTVFLVPQQIPVYRYEIVNVYPHDPSAFTEGLSYADGFLYEGTGLEGNSSLRKEDLTTGKILMIHNLSPEYFGEGITVYGGRIAQETEDNNFGFVYNRTSFATEGTFPYATEGWGLAWDGEDLIMSDGSATLTWLDPESFAVLRQVTVTAGGAPVKNLNELEYVNGEVFANIWPSYRIARISPQNGTVTGWIDLSGLPLPDNRNSVGWSYIQYIKGTASIPFDEEACPNGIAYDATGDRLFVTGKLWPSVYEIRLIRT